jgi:hypothetical protein
VEVRAASRRGLATATVHWEPPPEAGVGSISYLASVQFAIESKTSRETVVGTADGTMHVESRVRLRPDDDFGFPFPGETRLKMLATNSITTDGNVSYTETGETSKTEFKAAMHGSGLSHNPRADGDAPDVGFATTPDVWPITPEGGSVRYYARGGKHYYEIQLGPWPIDASLTWTRVDQFRCPLDATGRVTESYDNGTLKTTVKKEGPKDCVDDHAPKETTYPYPYRFGAISVDRSRPNPATGSSALVSGEYDPNDPAEFITGSETRTVTNCVLARGLDPVRVADLALPPFISMDGSGSVPGATCKLTYTLRWQIPRKAP